MSMPHLLASVNLFDALIPSANAIVSSRWFEKLCSMGPRYGYYPQPKKTGLIVDKEFDSEAHEKFDHLGVRVVRGHCFFGWFYWAINQFVQGKVKEWTNFITILSEAAQSYPQAAFVALSKTLQFEWSHLQRLIPNIGNAFIPVWNCFFCACYF